MRCLQYDNDQRLWTVIRSSCGSSAGTPNREFAREFRYDQDGRQRYLARELDPTPSQFTGDLVFEPLTPEGWEFTDYAGNSPYLDSSMTDANGSVPARFAQKRSYGPGGWQDIADDPNDPNDTPTVTDTRYAHGDLIGSTVATTDDAHHPVATAAYTAFGELVGGAGSGSLDTRYRYVGGHGYEADVLYGSHDPLNGPNTNLAAITLLHVGARWYDPGIGRFVQRDPIGLFGGINVYSYVENDPANAIDPSGLSKVKGERNWESGPPEPSDKPKGFDDLPFGEKMAICDDVIDKPKSRGHAEVWRAFRKHLRQIRNAKSMIVIGTGVVGIALDQTVGRVVDECIDTLGWAMEDLGTWNERPTEGPWRAGSWRGMVD